eukprot:UN07571
MKRKQLFEQKQNKLNQNEDIKANGQEDSDSDSDSDSIEVARSKYKFQYHGNVNSYKVYFDYGCSKNITMVYCGPLRKEWLTPIKCNFRKVKSMFRDIQQLEKLLSP